MLQGVYGSMLGCLHNPSNVQQTSSNSRVFWIHLLEVCWTFAGSCKHPISRLSIVVVIVCLSICHRCIVAKRCTTGPTLLLITNKKSHMSFQMTWISLILDDIVGQYCNWNSIVEFKTELSLLAGSAIVGSWIEPLLAELSAVGIVEIGSKLWSEIKTGSGRCLRL